MSTFTNERQRVQISLLILFSAFTSSRPATLLTDGSSSSNDSQKGSVDDLSSTLVNDSDGNTLINDGSDLKAQTIRPGTIYYEDINLFLLRNSNNPERDILIAEVDFRNLKGRPKGADG
jgi:Protein of unknown function (DUF3435)